MHTDLSEKPIRRWTFLFVYDDFDWRSEVMDMTYSPFQHKQFYPHPLFCVTL